MDLEAALRGDRALTPEQTDDLVARAYAEEVLMEVESVEIEREIVDLAADAQDPAVARRLRRLWLRWRTLNAKLSEVQRLSREVARRTRGEAGPPSL